MKLVCCAVACRTRASKKPDSEIGAVTKANRVRRVVQVQESFAPFRVDAPFWILKAGQNLSLAASTSHKLILNLHPPDLIHGCALRTYTALWTIASLVLAFGPAARRWQRCWLLS